MAFHLSSTTLMATLLLCSLLLPSTSAAPVRDVRQTEPSQQLASDMRSGLTTITLYAGQTAAETWSTSSIANLVDNSDYATTIGSLCDLLAYYDMLSRVLETTDEMRDLHLLLEKTVEDACHWVKYVNTTDEVTVPANMNECSVDSGEFAQFRVECAKLRVNGNPHSGSALVQINTEVGTHIEASVKPCTWTKKVLSEESEQQQLSSILAVLESTGIPDSECHS